MFKENVKKDPAWILYRREKKESRRLAIRTFTKNKLAVLGLFLFSSMVLLALLAPVIAPEGPFEFDVTERLLPPGESGYLLGTDTFGRDLMTRIIYGQRVSLYVGFVTSFLAMLVGLVVGLVAAYFSVWDTIFMRICEAMMSIPATLMAIALMAGLGATTENVVISLSIIFMPAIAKVTRASALSVKEITYVEAIKGQGAPWWRILFKHIAPNVISPVIVQTTYIFATAIIVESSLSFLGVGVPAPEPSLGNILSEARSVIFNSWWMTVFPGLTMVLTVLGINVLGDGIKDILDPLSK